MKQRQYSLGEGEETRLSANTTPIYSRLFNGQYLNDTNAWDYKPPAHRYSHCKIIFFTKKNEKNTYEKQIEQSPGFLRARCELKEESNSET